MDITGKIIPLGFSIDLGVWRSYYLDLLESYNDRKWTWDKGVEELHTRDAVEKCTTPAQRSMRGWMLQSNRSDSGEPSVMANSARKNRRECSESGEPEWSWRDLPLGPVQALSRAVPSIYRWTVYEMPPCGITPTHTDQDENVLLIPLYWPGSGQEFWLETERGWQDWSHCFHPGVPVLLDGHTPHWSRNNSGQLRVNIMARMPRVDIDSILDLEGAF